MTIDLLDFQHSIKLPIWGLWIRSIFKKSIHYIRRTPISMNIWNSKGRNLGRAGNPREDTACVSSSFPNQVIPVRMLSSPCCICNSRGEILAAAQRQNSHWLLLGSDFVPVHQNTGSSSRVTSSTAPVAASTVTVSSRGIFLQNLLGRQKGLHGHMTQSKKQKLGRRWLHFFWPFESTVVKARHIQKHLMKNNTVQ